MALRTLNLVVTDESRDGPAFDAAAALALRADAHLDLFALGVEPVAIEAMPTATSQMLIDAGRREAQEQAARLAGWAERRLPQGVRAAVEAVRVPGPGLTGTLGRLLRHADLALCPRPHGPGTGPLGGIVAESLLFGALLPVLFVPDAGCDLSRPWGRICIAWNDSDEALRAVRAALPFLQEAGQVDVAIVDPPPHAPDRADPGGALSLWLSRHGVRTEIAVLARTEPRVADTLLRFCRERGCEALVMGAYGHSRLREALLGGVTRDVLSSLPIPAVMAR
ncbi:Universal stress protein UspA/related nucleotide-binding protein [Rubellimicrobium thermophilum DSM 16684]|uniref:Universal stress protein UspA/related nucleotide-binding protein n=1 Tax=Rubellimicrobium thermophilum DSM 16684 TaxID=1123069 RepID=S9QWJ2_9RHOB|nr:universal stress protein [Rubellimicrobium thermophilum]EPX85761.1 Universal stress protein UspA/related nucleotide-binding protein [Rubellimicrobium thermophilum DSM 16684]